MITKQSLTNTFFTHKHIKFNKNDVLTPISNYIFKGKFEIDIESLYNYDKVDTNKICKLFNVDFIIKNTKTLCKKIDKKITVLKSVSDINNNDILDVSYLIYQFKDFNSFLEYIKTLKNVVILDIAKILGIPKMKIIFGFWNSETNSIPNSRNLNSIDVFILDKFLKSNIIDQHITQIKNVFEYYINYFKDNVYKSECPFIYLNKKDDLYFQRLKKVNSKYLFCVTDIL